MKEKLIINPIKFLILLSLTIFFACSDDDLNIDFYENLVNKTWTRQSFINDIGTNKKPTEYLTKDEYIFYDNGTYSIKTLRWNIDTTDFTFQFDTIINWGTWLFDEKNNIIKFTDNDTINMDDNLVLYQPDWRIIEMNSSSFIVKHIFMPAQDIYHRELFVLKD